MFHFRLIVLTYTQALVMESSAVQIPAAATCIDVQENNLQVWANHFAEYGLLFCRSPPEMYLRGESILESASEWDVKQEGVPRRRDRSS